MMDNRSLVLVEALQKTDAIQSCMINSHNNFHKLREFEHALESIDYLCSRQIKLQCRLLKEHQGDINIEIQNMYQLKCGTLICFKCLEQFLVCQAQQNLDAKIQNCPFCEQDSNEHWDRDDIKRIFPKLIILNSQFFNRRNKCETCLNQFIRNQIVFLKCGQMACKQCILDFIQKQVMAKTIMPRSLDEINQICMWAQKDHQPGKQYQEHFSIHDLVRISPLFSEKLISLTLKKQDELIECRCGNQFLTDKYQTIKCNLCYQIICNHCQQPFHDNVQDCMMSPLKEAKRQREHNISIFNQMKDEQSCFQCPNCQEIIEKSQEQDCDAIKCICNDPENPNAQYEFFSCCSVDKYKVDAHHIGYHRQGCQISDPSRFQLDFQQNRENNVHNEKCKYCVQKFQQTGKKEPCDFPEDWEDFLKTVAMQFDLQLDKNLKVVDDSIEKPKGNNLQIYDSFDFGLQDQVSQILKSFQNENYEPPKAQDGVLQKSDLEPAQNNQCVIF